LKVTNNFVTNRKPVRDFLGVNNEHVYSLPRHGGLLQFPGRQGLQCLSHALGHSPITYLTELRQRKFAIRLLNSSYSYQRRDISSESICRIVCTYQGRIQEFALAVPLHCPPFSPSFPHSSSLPSPLLNSFILPSPPLPIRPPLKPAEGLGAL